MDSSFIIDYWKGKPFARAFFDSFGENEPVWIPTLVFYELYVGSLLSDAAGDMDVASGLSWADPLPFDDGAAREAAAIRVDLRKRGMTINPVDILIAGVARSAEMTLVTTDDHFDRVNGLAYYNPATEG